MAALLSRVENEWVRPLARWDLAEDGVIVLQENNRGSTVETFRSMIEQSDLEILFTYRDYPTLTEESSFYFIGIGRRGWPDRLGLDLKSWLTLAAAAFWGCRAVPTRPPRKTIPESVRPGRWSHPPPRDSARR